MLDIRPATPADAGEILTLQRAAWVSEAQLHDAPNMPPLTQTLYEVREDITDQTVLVAVDGYRVAGYRQVPAEDELVHLRKDRGRRG